MFFECYTLDDFLISLIYSSSLNPTSLEPPSLSRAPKYTNLSILVEGGDPHHPSTWTLDSFNDRQNYL